MLYNANGKMLARKDREVINGIDNQDYDKIYLNNRVQRLIIWTKHQMNL